VKNTFLIAAATISLFGCKEGNSNDRGSSEYPNATSTKVRTDCEINPVGLVQELRRGNNLDSLIGCNGKITFQQSQSNAEGLVTILTDHNSGLPILILKSMRSQGQVAGTINRNIRCVYLGQQQFTNANGNSFVAASFQDAEEIQNPQYVSRQAGGLIY
jgi:hypothetical protein